MAVWELTVTGRVQGVGFRWFVKRLALGMEVTGWVRNMPDSSVLVLAQAQEDVLNVFVSLMRLGNSRASVAKIDISPLDDSKDYYDFEIRK
ncbi:MAG: acylphosphatase [Candidatus Cloacimonetes bacterium]|nr:acylphosphatase [Candidatus Cloacimonadota bacterium]NLO12250.1 acylphosphatase [Candidatus Cloacimonadota bacterium]